MRPIKETFELDNLGNKKNVKGYFNQQAHKYFPERYEHHKRNPVKYAYVARRNIVLNMLNEKMKNVLDIGCGPAVMSQYLAEKGCAKIYGIDVSEKVIEEARARTQGMEGKDKFFFDTGDIEHLNFPDSFFDVIICAGVIEYLLSDDKAVKEMHRVLKPGGFAIITVPNKLCAWVNIKKVNNLFTNLFSLNSGKKNKTKYRRKTYTPFKLNAYLKKRKLNLCEFAYYDYRFNMIDDLLPRCSAFLSEKLEIFSRNKFSRFFALSYIIKVTK